MEKGEVMLIQQKRVKLRQAAVMCPNLKGITSLKCNRSVEISEKLERVTGLE